MPCVKNAGQYQYDPSEVAKWLIETGKAVKPEEKKPDSDGPVFTKIREVANFFGVHSRSVKSWLEDPSFPGKSGKPGADDDAKGHFPAVAIAIWLRKSGKKAKVNIPASLVLPESTPTATTPTPRDRLVDVKTEQAMLELKRMQGRMIDAEEALAFYRRTNSYAVTVLKSLPSRIITSLPASVDERARNAIYEVALKVVNECRRMIAELVEGDQDAAKGPSEEREPE